jgi:predicted RNA-binding protein
MCQLNAYVLRSGQEGLLKENVTLVEVEREKVYLTSLFEERHAIDARVRLVDLVGNRLLLEPTKSEETEEMAEKTEKQKLAILLHHWIEHNTAHTREFQQGAEKAKDSGEHTVGDEILLAAEKLNEANDYLRIASEKLGHSPD